MGIELDDDLCLGVYKNKMKRQENFTGIYLQVASNMSIRGKDISVFHDSIAVSAADNVITDPPSTSHIAALDQRKPRDSGHQAAPFSAPLPNVGPVEEKAKQPLNVEISPLRTCSTRSCLLEDRASNRIAKNMKTSEFSHLFQDGSKETIVAKATTQYETTTTDKAFSSPSVGKSSSTPNIPKADAARGKNSAHLLAEKMAAKAQEKLKIMKHKQK